MTEPNFKDISQKLDTIIRLLTLAIIDGKKKGDQFILLSKAGFRPKKIAELSDSTPNTVSVELSRLRKGKAKR